MTLWPQLAYNFRKNRFPIKEMDIVFPLIPPTNPKSVIVNFQEIAVQGTKLSLPERIDFPL